MCVVAVINLFWWDGLYATPRNELIIHHWSYTSGESSNWSCVCVWSVRTHISVTTGKNFLILDMMIGYDVGLMPVVKF